MCLNIPAGGTDNVKLLTLYLTTCVCRGRARGVGRWCGWALFSRWAKYRRKRPTGGGGGVSRRCWREECMLPTLSTMQQYQKRAEPAHHDWLAEAAVLPAGPRLGHPALPSNLAAVAGRLARSSGAGGCTSLHKGQPFWRCRLHSGASFPNAHQEHLKRVTSHLISCKSTHTAPEKTNSMLRDMMAPLQSMLRRAGKSCNQLQARALHFQGETVSPKRPSAVSPFKSPLYRSLHKMLVCVPRSSAITSRKRHWICVLATPGLLHHPDGWSR